MATCIDSCAKVITYVATALKIGSLDKDGVGANKRTNRKEIGRRRQCKRTNGRYQCRSCKRRECTHGWICPPYRHRRHLSSTDILTTLNVHSVRTPPYLSPCPCQARKPAIKMGKTEAVRDHGLVAMNTLPTMFLAWEVLLSAGKKPSSPPAIERFLRS